MKSDAWPVNLIASVALPAVNAVVCNFPACIAGIFADRVESMTVFEFVQDSGQQFPRVVPERLAAVLTERLLHAVAQLLADRFLQFLFYRRIQRSKIRQH